MNKNGKHIGIIAEDDSDVASLKTLIKRIKGQSTLSFKHFVGRGCGKIKRKSQDWAKQLKNRGCNVLIVVHDLDANNHGELYSQLEDGLKPFEINKTLICIPVQEMEAWFLADEKSLKTALKLAKTPKIFHHPEKVNSPKEVLGKVVEKASNDTKVYLNTKHNLLIAQQIHIQTVRKKCSSFEALYKFTIENI